MANGLVPQIVIGTRNPPNPPSRSTLPETPLVIRHHAEWTQAALHVSATVIDRSECFEEVLRSLRSLQNAIGQYNASNTNAVATIQAYRTAEITHAKQLPNVPRLMKDVVDAMLGPKRASSSSASSSSSSSGYSSSSSSLSRT
jgi:hypothetical protein